MHKNRAMERRDLTTAATLAATALAAGALLRRVREESLAGEVAVITGASRGLGLAIARELADAGCRLVTCARDDAEIRRAAMELAQRGAEVVPVVCDVSVREDVERLIATANEYYGRVDIVVNNAGVIEVGPSASMTLDDFAAMMDILYWGTVHTTMAVLPGMRERRHGRIVNITSIGGKISIPHLLAYSGAKFAAVGFSEGLHAEVAKDGIAVTTVVPGLMRTGSFRNAFFKGDAEHEYGWFSIASRMPLLTISSRRAAKLIVRAIRRRSREVTLGASAKLGAKAQGLAPGTVAALMGVVNRFLPRDETPREVIGFEAEKLRELQQS